MARIPEPKNPAEFRRRAVAAFKAANPDAVNARVAIEWKHSARVVFKDGSPGFSGVFAAAAPGFRPRPIIASWDAISGLVVR